MPVVNECISFYEPGSDITGFTTAGVTGKRFVRISANQQGTPVGSGMGVNLDSTASGGTVTVETAAAGGRVFGVARYDAAANSFVGVARSPGMVVPVKAGANIAAFQEVMSDASGQAIPATGTGAFVVGYALTGASSGADAKICLYGSARLIP